jgi:single-strand DNA-binding protein
MASFNKVIMIGNLTRDPELRTTPKGTAVCSFSLALNRHYKTESGEERDETTFVDIEAYGKQAELIGKYLVKGRPLMVEGRLKLDSWEKNGEKRSRLKVVTENFQFMGYKDDAAVKAPGEAAAPAVEAGDYDNVSPQARTTPAAAKPTVADDDVPF